jgi:8-oxo-dGTP pyrophosphatase MutT (NUDIX family)
MENRFSAFFDHTWLQQRLNKNRAPLTKDMAWLNTPIIPAAVLVAIVLREKNMGILLTQRSSQLKHHAGQIAFPGGKIEQSDKSPEDAAVRETAEEIGIEKKYILPVGRLGDYITVTGFRVTPIVATLSPLFSLSPSFDEVQHIFELPLALCLDQRQYQQRVICHPKGTLRVTHLLPYKEQVIWGATATILYHLGMALEWPLKSG